MKDQVALTIIGGASRLVQLGGAKVTLIDLGLARMDGYGGEQRWTKFDKDILQGKGDYQFDVYRMMRAHNGNDWATFQPFTNIMVRFNLSWL